MMRVLLSVFLLLGAVFCLDSIYLATGDYNLVKSDSSYFLGFTENGITEYNGRMFNSNDKTGKISYINDGEVVSHDFYSYDTKTTELLGGDVMGSKLYITYYDKSGTEPVFKIDMFDATKVPTQAGNSLRSNVAITPISVDPTNVLKLAGFTATTPNIIFMLFQIPGTTKYMVGLMGGTWQNKMTMTVFDIPNEDISKITEKDIKMIQANDENFGTLSDFSAAFSINMGDQISDKNTFVYQKVKADKTLDTPVTLTLKDSRGGGDYWFNHITNTIYTFTTSNKSTRQMCIYKVDLTAKTELVGTCNNHVLPDFDGRCGIDGGVTEGFLGCKTLLDDTCPDSSECLFKEASIYKILKDGSLTKIIHGNRVTEADDDAVFDAFKTEKEHEVDVSFTPVKHGILVEDLFVESSSDKAQIMYFKTDGAISTAITTLGFVIVLICALLF